jgi:hypothetical protein
MLCRACTGLGRDFKSSSISDREEAMETFEDVGPFAVAAVAEIHHRIYLFGVVWMSIFPLGLASGGVMAGGSSRNTIWDKKLEALPAVDRAGALTPMASGKVGGWCIRRDKEWYVVDG